MRPLARERFELSKAPVAGISKRRGGAGVAADEANAGGLRGGR